MQETIETALSNALPEQLGIDTGFVAQLVFNALVREGWALPSYKGEKDLNG
jgi:hypothetical protein